MKFWNSILAHVSYVGFFFHPRKDSRTVPKTIDYSIDVSRTKTVTMTKWGLDLKASYFHPYILNFWHIFKRMLHGSTNNCFSSRIVFLKRSSRFRAKLRGRHRDSPYTPCPIQAQPPHYHPPPVEWYTHHNHPKSTVYIRVHSCCCAFCGFRQMWNDMYSSLWYPTKYLHSLKVCALTIHPSPSSNTKKPLIILLSP